MQKKTRTSKMAKVVRAVKTLSELRAVIAKMTPLQRNRLDEEINIAASRVAGA